MAFLAGPSRLGSEERVITYRHLLSSQAATVFHPLRTIAHCDIDGAFAQFEQVRLGLPDDVPLICIQWNSIIAVNYPARAYGIKRFTGIPEAKKLCPDLVVQHVATFREGDDEAGYWDDVDRRTHKVSLDPYRRESLKILSIFREMVPKGEIEKASIDEAFMDFTPLVVERILAAHPHLAAVPPDAPDGLDSPLPPAPPVDWAKCGNVLPILRPDQDAVNGEGVEIDDQPDSTWEDWSLCIGAELMAEVRAEVWKRLHYTCSAGISYNKSLAKLCSSWKKPDAQTVLRQAATPGFLRNLEFTDIRMLGGKLGNAIATEFNAKTVGDLLSVSLEDIQARFGEESIWVYNIIRGIDHTEIKEKLVTKSMLASKNCIPNVRTHAMGQHWLSILAGELSLRLREGREAAPGLWPKSIVLVTRSANDPLRSRQSPFPFNRNLTPHYILKHATKLWDEETENIKPGTMRYHNISLQFTGLEQLEDGQRGIESFFSAGAKPGANKRNEPEPCSSASAPAGAPQSKKPRSVAPDIPHKPKIGIGAFLLPKPVQQVQSVNTTSGDTGIEDHASSSSIPDGPKGPLDQATSSWSCSQCSATLSPPVEIHELDREQWLTAARQEHEDYHYALSLQETVGDSFPTSSRPCPPRDSKRSTKSKKPVGIEAFFSPRK